MLFPVVLWSRDPRPHAFVMNPLADSLSRSPELFPQSIDLRTDVVTLIRLGLADYLAASFLDDRVLSPRTVRRTVPWPELERAIAETALKETCHYIFHIGHAGSTLLSRLIGSQPGVFSLREPAILRTLAQVRALPASPWGVNGYEQRQAGFLRLWSRTFEPESRAVVKATSFVSEIAAEILARSSQPRAILMFVSPESYLATIMGGENAPREAAALAPARLARLQRRLGLSLPPLTKMGLGEVVAMSWACEMLAIAAARHAAPDRTILVDFDVLLIHPLMVLEQTFRHLLLDHSDALATMALTAPDMGRYSKAPEHAYDAKLREAVLNQARANYGAEIRRGLAWLERLSQQHAAVREAINLAE